MRCPAAGASSARGTDHAGLFSNDDALAEKLAAAGKAVEEKLWRLPLADAYDKQIDSDIADMKNITGNRDAGSIIGGQLNRSPGLGATQVKGSSGSVTPPE